MHLKYRAATALGSSLIGLVPVAAFAQTATPFDWSGFYVGGHMGVVQSGGSANIGNSVDPESLSYYTLSGGTLTLGSITADSGLPTLFNLQGTDGAVGIDAGYNIAQGNFVFGIEGDYDLLAGGGHTRGSVTSPSGDTTINFDSSLNSLATLRGRVGISADRLLFFATAGLAAGQTSLSSDLGFADYGKSASAAGSTSTTAIGYVAGGGVELAASDNVTLRAEALYYNLGQQSVTSTGNGLNIDSEPVGFSPYATTTTPQGVIIDTGVNFKF